MASIRRESPISTAGFGKARITSVADPERNYHIFYSLLHAFNEQFGEAIAESPQAWLKLQRVRFGSGAASFRYLNGSKKFEVPKHDDAAKLVELWRNLETLQIDADTSV